MSGILVRPVSPHGKLTVSILSSSAECEIDLLRQLGTGCRTGRGKVLGALEVSGRKFAELQSTPANNVDRTQALIQAWATLAATRRAIVSACGLLTL